MRNSIINAFISLTISFVVTACSSDGAKEKDNHHTDGKTLTVAVTPTMDCVPFLVAKEIGIDEDMGCQLELQLHASKADCDSALIKGSVAALMTDCVRADNLNAEWNKRKHKSKADTLSIYSHANMRLYIFTNSKSRLREAKQLTDKIIGLDRQSVEARMAQHMLDSVKLSDDKAFLVQVRSYDIRQRMFYANTLDAAVFPEPYATVARKAGHGSIYAITTYENKPIGRMIARKSSSKLSDIYNRACDSINTNGLHRYDSVMVKHFNMPLEVVHSIPAFKFGKIKHQ